MIGLLTMLLAAAVFAVWDRRSPLSSSPDNRLVRIGAVSAAVGAASSLLLWWLIVPVFVFFAGCAMIVIGRHRVVGV